MKRSLSLLLPLLPLPLLADTAGVEQCVRQERFPEALASADPADDSPEAFYWKGRALAGLQRLTEAALCFSKVPQGHPLYPYAAKGIIYCAWKSNIINFVEAVAPLTISEDAEIAAMSTAALAEFQLRHTVGGDTASLDELRRLVQKHPNLLPTLRLLEVENLRRLGKYDEAIAHCREIEADKTLSTATHHRARLALAEICYAQEAANSGKPIDENSDAVVEEGMGEETLLQFISANPESPLLQEAFRRLALHRAFTTSKYTNRRLFEWRSDLSNPHRAALALLMLQRAAFAGQNDVSGSTLANAASALPGEKEANIVIMEQVRSLLAHGDRQQAELFLSLLPEQENAYSRFFRAYAQAPDSKEVMEAYLKSAEIAPGDLQPTALANALFCAYKSGEMEAVRDIMQADYPRHIRRILLLLEAKLLQGSDPEKALADLQELDRLTPNHDQEAESALIRAGITMKTDPSATLAILLAVPEETSNAWRDEQLLSYYRLQLEAVDTLTNRDANAGIDRARKILAQCKHPAVSREMTLDLAERLAAQGQHGEALQLLEQLAVEFDAPELKARALIRAAEEAAKLGSQDSLAKSIDLFEQCSRIVSPYANRADIHRARVLMWTNRLPESMQLLHSIVRREGQLDANDLALAYTALADSYSMLGTEEARQSAMEYSAKVQEIPGISEQWRIRSLMQHASFSSRYGHHDTALQDYLRILETFPEDIETFSRAQLYVLAYAGSGAVHQYMQLHQLTEAADLADKIAALFSKDSSSSSAEQVRLFSSWANNIRRTNY